MLRYSRRLIGWVVMCAIVGWAAPSTRAATIIKLNLGADAAEDVQYSAGVFSTVNDGVVGTSGNQNTAVEFLDFLELVAADIAADASFTLDGLIPSAPATIFGGTLLAQDFTQGTLALYAADNTLLLSGKLSISAVTGTLVAPGQHGLFAAFAEVTGGVLAPYLDRDSLRLKMRLPTLNGGVGFSVDPPPGDPPPFIHIGQMDPFTATATIEILAEAIPEPFSFALSWIGAALIGAAARRKWRR